MRWLCMLDAKVSVVTPPLWEEETVVGAGAERCEYC